MILRSQANLVASLAAPWSEAAREAARIILSRIAAEEEARTTRELRVKLGDVSDKLLRKAETKFGAILRERGGGSLLVFDAPANRVAPFADWLIAHGARTVTSGRLDYVFRADNELWTRLSARLGGG